jgi:hypothetical protein
MICNKRQNCDSTLFLVPTRQQLCRCVVGFCSRSELCVAAGTRTMVKSTALSVSDPLNIFRMACLSTALIRFLPTTGTMGMMPLVPVDIRPKFDVSNGTVIQ